MPKTLFSNLDYVCGYSGGGFTNYELRSYGWFINHKYPAIIDKKCKL